MDHRVYKLPSIWLVILLVFQASEKNPGILRFGSLSVKVKKTTKAVNNYFGSEKKHSLDSNMNNGFLSGINSGSSSNVANAAASLFDADRMPPPKFAPSKKTRQVVFFIRTNIANDPISIYIYSTL